MLRQFIDRILVLSVALASAFGFVTPAIQAQDIDPQLLLKHVHDGNWVVHVDFPYEESVLYGFAAGFTEQFERYCPQYRLQAEEEVFMTSLGYRRLMMADLMTDDEPRSSVESHFSRLDLEAYFADAAEVRAAREVGAVAAESFSDASCGSGSRVHRLASNAAHLAAGRRAAFGGPEGPTLVQEEVDIIEKSDTYEFDLFFDRKTGPVLRNHYDTARSVGVTVLSCRYDVDPARDTYVEQLYWGPGFASLLHGTGFSWLLLPVLQKQLTDAAGHSAFTHPFLTLGPPRVECPPFPDPDLQENNPDKPRSEIIRDPVDPSEIPEPEVTGGDWFEYGRVPDDFVPSLDIMDSCCYTIKMDKDGHGVLNGIATKDWFNIVWGGGRGWGSDAPPIIQEDFERAEGYSWVECIYTGETRSYAYKFWHHEAPDWATEAYLSSRHPEHHLLLIGPAIEMCPMEREAALDLHPYF